MQLRRRKSHENLIAGIQTGDAFLHRLVSIGHAPTSTACPLCPLIADISTTPLTASLFQHLHHRAGDGVGDAEPAAKVFKRVAERVERRDHAVACVDKRIHVGPFGDDAEGMLASLDDIGVTKPRPKNAILL